MLANDMQSRIDHRCALKIRSCSWSIFSLPFCANRHFRYALPCSSYFTYNTIRKVWTSAAVHAYTILQFDCFASITGLFQMTHPSDQSTLQSTFDALLTSAELIGQPATPGVHIEASTCSMTLNWVLCAVVMSFCAEAIGNWPILLALVALDVLLIAGSPSSQSAFSSHLVAEDKKTTAVAHGAHWSTRLLFSAGCCDRRTSLYGNQPVHHQDARVQGTSPRCPAVCLKFTSVADLWWFEPALSVGQAPWRCVQLASVLVIDACVQLLSTRFVWGSLPCAASDLSLEPKPMMRKNTC